MTKTIELINNIKTMIGGIRMTEVNGVLHTNFNDSIDIFKSTEWGIVELSRIKNVLNKIGKTEIYHPNAYISSQKIINMEDLTKDKAILEAYANRKSVFRCGIVNGSYKEVIIDTFNSIVQEKVKEKIKIMISEKMELSFSLIDELLNKNKISKEENLSMKDSIMSEYEDIMNKYNIDLKFEINKYCIFTKGNALLTINSIVQNIILDTNFFKEISLINHRDMQIAMKENIDYEIKPSFMVFSDLLKAA